jgi:hypothetical protein
LLKGRVIPHRQRQGNLAGQSEQPEREPPRERPHPQENAGGNGAKILDRYYTLTPTGDSYTASICFSYTDAELGELNESNLHLCRWTGSNWSCPNRGAGSNTTNWVCADGVTTFSDWVMGDVGPMAVTLRSFTASGKATANIPYASVVLAGAGVCLAGVWRLRERRR